MNARSFESGDLCCSRAPAAADNGASMTHSPSRRSRSAGDKASDGLAAVRMDPLRGFFFRRPSDLTDHDDPVRLRIVVKHFYDIEMGSSVDRVSPYPDTSGLSNSPARELPDRFIG